jgi:hypothetical protein
MTFGSKNTDRGTAGVFELSPAEWKRFQARKPVVATTGDAHGDYEVTIKLTRKRRSPGSTYEVNQALQDAPQGRNADGSPIRS